MTSKKKASNELSVMSYVQEARRRSLPFLCFECLRVYPDHYMVTEEVWLEAYPQYRQLKGLIRAQVTVEERKGRLRGAGVYACLECLEGLLDRPLEPEDFPDHLPINYPIHFGVQMALRQKEQG